MLENRTQPDSCWTDNVKASLRQKRKHAVLDDKIMMRMLDLRPLWWASAKALGSVRLSSLMTTTPFILVG